MKKIKVIKNGIIQAVSTVENAELDAAILSLSEQFPDSDFEVIAQELEQCYASRVLEYPTIADQMDALFHARQGNNTQLIALDEQIKAVKLKYPKPL